MPEDAQVINGFPTRRSAVALERSLARPQKGKGGHVKLQHIWGNPYWQGFLQIHYGSELIKGPRNNSREKIIAQVTAQDKYEYS